MNKKILSDKTPKISCNPNHSINNILQKKLDSGIIEGFLSEDGSI